MNRNESHVETYEAPEVFDLGGADELTLGDTGCNGDCCGCKKCCGGGDLELM